MYTEVINFLYTTEPYFKDINFTVWYIWYQAVLGNNYLLLLSAMFDLVVITQLASFKAWVKFAGN